MAQVAICFSLLPSLCVQAVVMYYLIVLFNVS